MSDYLNLGMLLSILHELGIESSQPYKLISVFITLVLQMQKLET